LGTTGNDWDEFPPRDGILNPGYELEWERYQQKLATDFMAWQTAIVNDYKRSGQFITQNFVGGIRTNIDEYELALAFPPLRPGDSLEGRPVS
jgi:beta-galactosidase